MILSSRCDSRGQGFPPAHVGHGHRDGDCRPLSPPARCFFSVLDSGTRLSEFFYSKA